jgi:hypothetical protein
MAHGKNIRTIRYKPYAISQLRNEEYESFSAVCLEGDDRSDAFALMHKIEGLVNSFQGKPVRDHRINLDLAA